jgi:UrcA family protein
MTSCHVPNDGHSIRSPQVFICRGSPDRSGVNHFLRFFNDRLSPSSRADDGHQSKDPPSAVIVTRRQFQRGFIMVRAFLLGIAVLATSPLFAEAPSSDGPLTARVSYADLNLANPAGQKVLRGRIRRAVNQVCPELNSSILSVIDAAHCRHAVSQEASRQMTVLVAAADRRSGSMSVVASR